MTLIAGIWTNQYVIIASDTRETVANNGIFQNNDEFNKILKYPEIAIGFSGDSVFASGESVIDFVRNMFAKYVENINIHAFFEELNNSIPFHEKPNTDLYLLGFIKNSPVCVEYKIAVNDWVEHHQRFDNGIVFNFNLDHPNHQNLKGNILKHFIEQIGIIDPNFNELSECDSINLLRCIYDDLIEDINYENIGGKMVYYIFSPTLAIGNNKK